MAADGTSLLRARSSLRSLMSIGHFGHFHASAEEPDRSVEADLMVMGPEAEEEAR